MGMALSGNGPKRDCGAVRSGPLTTLLLPGNRIGDRGASLIAKALRTNATLAELNLFG